MKIFKKEPDFKFMNKRYIAFAFSGLIILIGALFLKTSGFNLGIDFTGGTMIEVSFKESTNEKDLRSVLARIGLGKSLIQRIGGEQKKFFIKTVNIEEEASPAAANGQEEDEVVENIEKVSNRIKEAFINKADRAEIEAGKSDLNTLSQKKIIDLLTSKGTPLEEAEASVLKIVELRDNPSGLIMDFAELEKLDMKKTVLSVLKEHTYLGNFKFLSIESVGPQVGHDLRTKAALATFWALLGMLIYIAFRFKFIYGLSAVITLLHDILITLSFILFFQIEVSLSVVAALLTIVGYSLNDTIVIFDRVRDNVKLMRREEAAKLLDRSVNQTLSRTIVTSGTTLLTVLALFLFGGEVIHNFSATLMVGIIIGTYSSIFQSCAWLKIWEKYFLGRKKN